MMTEAKPLTHIQQISSTIESEDMSAKLAASLDGTGISPERFKRSALVALGQDTAKYLVEKCSKASIYTAIMQAATCGLDLHPAIAHCYVIPRGGKAQLQVSFKGKIALAMASDAVAAIDVGVIREGDDYTYETGTHPKLTVRPSFDEEGEWIAAYVITHYHGGVSVPTLMTKKQILAHRDKYSEAYKRGGKAAATWKDTPEEMAKKTVIHRAAKSWPITIPGGDGDGDVDVVEARQQMRDITPANHLDNLADDIAG